MSFEVKYDRNRNPIMPEIPAEQPEQVVVPEPVYEQRQEETASELVNEQFQEDTASEQLVGQRELAEQREQAAKKTDAQSSFRALREKADRVERERDELIKRLQESERQKQNTNAEDDNIDFDIAPDDLAEGKHLSKVSKKIKSLESQLNQYKQQTATANTEILLKSKYPDFDKVVSQENCVLLREQYPELADTILSNKDLYAQSVSAYTLIKRLGIARNTAFDNDKALAQKNAAKPRTLASISPQQGDSPLSHANAFANGLTTELKDQLRREMEQARQH